MPRFRRTTHRISLAAMLASMSLVFLYLASILPAGRVAAYFLSSVFVMGLVLEEEIGLSWLMFAAVSALSLLLMPNIIRVVPYVLFFGHYGIGKYYIQTRVKDRVAGYILKLLYFNASLVLMYLLARQIIEQDLLKIVKEIWLAIVLAEIAFVVYDYAFTKVTAYYFNNIRRFLMKS
jgi:hypothetical protein